MMSNRVVFTNQEFNEGFQNLAEQAKLSHDIQANPERVEQFFKNWEQMAQQTLLTANLERIGTLTGLIEPFSKVHPRGLMLFQRYQGKLALIKGEYPEASRAFKEEHDLAEFLSDTIGLILANLNLAEALKAQGQVKLTERHLQQALQLSYDHNLVLYEVKTLNRLAQLYLPQQRWDNIQTSLEHSFYLLQNLKKQTAPNTFEMLFLEVEEAFNRQLAGLNHAMAKQWELAEKTLLESLTLSYRCKDKLGAIEAELVLGSVAYQSGQYNKALVYFNGGRAESEQFGYLEGLVRGHYYISLIYFAQKQYPKALGHARRAMKSGQYIGKGIWLAWATYQVGQIYKQLDMKQLALEKHLEAGKLHSPEDQYPQWIELLIGLGDYLVELPEQPQNWEEGLKCYRQAIKLMEANERLEHLAGVMGKIAQTFIKLKGEQGLDEAERCYQLELRLAGDLDSTILPPSVAVPLRVEALTGIQRCAALRAKQIQWQLPAEFQSSL
jgi:tetratricopeptide (TPR) repeat protein